MIDSIGDLGQGTLVALTTMWSEVAAFAPNFVGALVILAVGYVVARILSAVVRRLLSAIGFDHLAEKTGVADQLTRMNVNRPASGIFAAVVFWILMLAFLLSASESLGLERLSETIDSLVRYLPRVLGAILILSIGLFVATFTRDTVRAGMTNIGSEHAHAIGQAAYVLLAVIAIALAVGQLELETVLLTVAVTVVLTAAGVAIALAFGLGSREVAANVLAGAYLRDSLPEGTQITVAGVQGEVKAVEALSTVVVTEDGETSVPNMTLVRENVHITTHGTEPGV
ncbi:MAG: mechanosensitive ion channel [Gammaproteobacteria bacterium]|nr:mechanosensitive ion channel [Gammaproteobacteria bacterium]